MCECEGVYESTCKYEHVCEGTCEREGVCECKFECESEYVGMMEVSKYNMCVHM